MGVIYFLICVRKHKSNLPTNIRTTAGEENTMIYKKMRPFELNHLLYFMIAWCVFFYESVRFFTNGVCHVFHQNIMCLCFSIRTLCVYVFCKTVLSVGKKIHTLPRYDLIFPYQMT